MKAELSRRDLVKYGVAGTFGAAGVGSLWLGWRGESSDGAVAIFEHDAPQGELWAAWQARGWVKEARHYRELGKNLQCQVCPNECLLGPEDRSHCRNKVHKDGKIYTLAYGNPASVHIDPIEKKPLFHFLPSSPAFSIATSGCSFRCLNCQNWELSQKRPEDLKVVEGPELRLTLANAEALGRVDIDRASLFPEAVVDFARATGCASIAYTYAEPTSFYEYMLDTARAARTAGVRNVWVTNGYIRRQALEELAEELDAANVDLKSFSAATYQKLNGGQLQPVLETLKTLREAGVWVEVTNLMVPTYTDDPDETRRMCEWLVEHLGPDVPLHLSCFYPKYKLEHLPATPPGVLVEAKRIAHEAGLHFVYLGNVRGIPEAQTTLCPGCGKAVVRRTGYNVLDREVSRDGKCGHCGGRVAGVWG